VVLTVTSGVATKWTKVDMSTPLFGRSVFETDANLSSFLATGGSWGGDAGHSSVGNVSSERSPGPLWLVWERAPSRTFM